MNQKSQVTGTIISYSGQMHDFVAWMLCSANKFLAYHCLACIYLANCRLTCSRESCIAVSQALCSSLLPCEAIRVPIRTGSSKTGISIPPLCRLEVKPVELLSMKDYIHHPNTRPSLDLSVCPLHFSIILPLTYLILSPSPPSFPPSRLKPPSLQVATVLPSHSLWAEFVLGSVITHTQTSG